MAEEVVISSMRDASEAVEDLKVADVYAFKVSHQGVDKKELCNGHDIFERIFVLAHNAKVSNFAKKPFFRRLRRAYPQSHFVNTSLYGHIKVWETISGYSVLAV